MAASAGLSGVNKYQYEGDRRDCDNFAAVLHGNEPLRLKVNTAAYVVDFSGRHAYNALAVAEFGGGLSIAVVEPQTFLGRIRGSGAASAFPRTIVPA